MKAPAAFRRAGWLLPALSGLALGLTFTPFGGPLLPFLAFAPLGWHLAGPPVAGTGLKAGFVTSVVAHGIGLQWMVPALSWRTPLAVPTYITVLALTGVLAAAALEAVHGLRRRLSCPLPLALALTWLASEWAAARVPGVAYAWLNAGASLAWHTELSWLAPLGGGGALTLWTVLIGGWVGEAAYRLAERGRPHDRPRPAPRAGPLTEGVAFALVLVVPLAGGLWDRTGPRVPAGEVLGVQPGRGPGPGDVADQEDGIRRQLDGSPADLVVFPERFLHAVPAPGGDEAAVATRLGVPLLFGAPDVAVPASGDTAWYNAAFLVEPGPAGGWQVAHKRHLVPGLEDAGSGVGALLRGRPSGYRPASAPAVVTLRGRSVGVLICYDSAFPSHVRSLAARGAELLIVISNDDWLDPDGPPRATIAYWQHATQGRLRARENGLPLVQVASTGRTFSVDGRGRSFAPVGMPSDTVPLFAAAVVRLPVGRAGPPTVFRRSGEVLGPLALTLWLLGAWPVRRRRVAVVPNRG